MLHEDLIIPDGPREECSREAIRVQFLAILWVPDMATVTAIGRRVRPG
jgi:hypothetical protein